MWREDNRVAGLEANQRLKDSCRGWVSGRNNTADKTDRFSDSDGTKGVVSRKHTAGLLIFVCVIDIFRSEVVFNHFIFHNTHTGFCNGQLSERDSRIGGSQSGGTEDFINLFLRKVGIFTLGFFHAFNECVKFSDVSNGHNDLLIMLNSFSKSVAQRINTTV